MHRDHLLRKGKESPEAKRKVGEVGSHDPDTGKGTVPGTA